MTCFARCWCSSIGNGGEEQATRVVESFCRKHKRGPVVSGQSALFSLPRPLCKTCLLIRGCFVSSPRLRDSHEQRGSESPMQGKRNDRWATDWSFADNYTTGVPEDSLDIGQNTYEGGPTSLQARPVAQSHRPGVVARGWTGLVRSTSMARRTRRYVKPIVCP